MCFLIQGTENRVPRKKGTTSLLSTSLLLEQLWFFPDYTVLFQKCREVRHFFTFKGLRVYRTEFDTRATVYTGIADRQTRIVFIDASGRTVVRTEHTFCAFV